MANPTDKLDAQSKAVLEAMSVLNSKGIPSRIIEKIPATVSFPGYPLTRTDFQKARTDLIQRNFITHQEGGLVIHPLAQDLVRAITPDDRFSTVFSSMVSVIYAVWPYKESTFGINQDRWLLCIDLFPHILELRGLVSRFQPSPDLTEAHLDGPELFIEAAS